MNCEVEAGPALFARGFLHRDEGLVEFEAIRIRVAWDPDICRFAAIEVEVVARGQEAADIRTRNEVGERGCFLALIRGALKLNALLGHRGLGGAEFVALGGDLLFHALHALFHILQVGFDIRSQCHLRDEQKTRRHKGNHSKKRLHCISPWSWSIEVDTHLVPTVHSSSLTHPEFYRATLRLPKITESKIVIGGLSIGGIIVGGAWGVRS